jgi:uncharacterized protein YigE (DUF2233 family)
MYTTGERAGLGKMKEYRDLGEGIFLETQSGPVGTVSLSLHPIFKSIRLRKGEKPKKKIKIKIKIKN